MTVADPLFEGRVVAIPTWLCPKCGAVCDVQFQAPLTDWERAELADQEAYYALPPDERKAHHRHQSERATGFGYGDRKWRRDLPPEGRLWLRCTRCAHGYHDRPMDAR